MTAPATRYALEIVALRDNLTGEQSSPYHRALIAYDPHVTPRGTMLEMRRTIADDRTTDGARTIADFLTEHPEITVQTDPHGLAHHNAADGKPDELDEITEHEDIGVSILPDADTRTYPAHLTRAWRNQAVRDLQDMAQRTAPLTLSPADWAEHTDNTRAWAVTDNLGLITVEWVTGPTTLGWIDAADIIDTEAAAILTERIRTGDLGDDYNTTGLTPADTDPEPADTPPME